MLSVILPDMAEPETLSEFVKRLIAEKKLTVREVAKRSRGGISPGYVHDIIVEKTLNPTVDKLRALAKGLGVTDDEMIAVAWSRVPLSEDEMLSAIFHQVADYYKTGPEEDRTVVREMVSMVSRWITEREKKRA